MSDHSQAPWTVTRVHPQSDSDRILDADGMIVCETNHPSMGRSVSSSANGVLIAASPDLLAVMKEIANFDFPNMPPELARKIREKARAAIAKATK